MTRNVKNNLFGVEQRNKREEDSLSQSERPNGIIRK
jgi:hypothetical protein